MQNTYQISKDYKNITMFGSGVILDNPLLFKNQRVLLLKEAPAEYVYGGGGQLVGKRGGHIMEELLYLFDGVDTLTRIEIDLPALRSNYPAFVGQHKFICWCFL